MMIALFGQASTQRRQRMQRDRNSSSATAPGGRNGRAAASSPRLPRRTPAAAAQPPEKLGVFLLAGDEEGAIGRDHVARTKAVDGKTVFSHQVTDAATEGQSGHSGVTDNAASEGQAESLSLVVDRFPKTTALHPGGAFEWVGSHAIHIGEVDHQTAIG